MVSNTLPIHSICWTERTEVDVRIRLESNSPSVRPVFTVEALRLRLNEGNESAVRVRQETVLTLGAIGGPDVSQALLGALRDDSSPQVRWRAALALSRLGDASVVPALREALSTEADTQVREHIERAIAAL